MFDLTLAVFLALGIGRCVRCRSLVGALSCAVALAHLLVAATLVASRLPSGNIAIPFGVVVLGPSALGEAAPGPASWLVHPFVIATSTTLMSLAGWYAVRRQAAPLFPESTEARRLSRAGLSLVGAGCLSAVRMVTYLFFLLWQRDRFE